MKSGEKNCEDLSSVSIRKGPAQNVLSDTNGDEKVQTPVLDIEALRVIGRKVRSIKTRVDVYDAEHAYDVQPGSTANRGSAHPCPIGCQGDETTR